VALILINFEEFDAFWKIISKRFVYFQIFVQGIDHHLRPRFSNFTGKKYGRIFFLFLASLSSRGRFLVAVAGIFQWWPIFSGGSGWVILSVCLYVCLCLFIYLRLTVDCLFLIPPGFEKTFRELFWFLIDWLINW